jgi:hypothetical protein
MDKIKSRAIVIKPSKTADSRTCDFTKVTKDELLESSKQHISDIKRGFEFYRAVESFILVCLIALCTEPMY